MTYAYEDAGKAGKEMMASGLKSFAVISRQMQAISLEATDYARRAFESGSATAEKLVSAKTLDKVVEIQSDYLKRSCEGMVAQASRMGELYADMAKEAYRPFESVVAKAR